ncbi:MAG: FadR family transcriptional regulator [Planctomycetota bacterium]|jgi:GntR family transcriptional repressor for pyruvate dehydrogenase complex|nr:FadR family transcriptional regulator [Planctomycetota bacterium]
MTLKPKTVMDPLKKKTRLYEDIVQQIIGKIESGELKTGDRLPTERDLGEQLGVSRTSVREALRALELLGIIESKVSEGTFVKQSDLDRILLRFNGDAADEKRVSEIYEMRILLETFSARQAARKRTPAHLKAMRDAIEAMKNDIAGGNRGQSPDNLFHKIIAEAADNSVLNNILALCAEMIASSIRVANAHVNVNDIIEEHEKMYKAIEKRNDKLAERLMRAHIRRALERTRFVAGAAAKE